MASRVQGSGRFIKKVKLVSKHIEDSREIEKASIRLERGVNELE